MTITKSNWVITFNLDELVEVRPGLMPRDYREIGDALVERFNDEFYKVVKEMPVE